MLNEGKKLASPQDIEKATRNFRRKTEIKKSIESIPLKERLALYTDDTIPLTGKYKALDEDVIDFYDDIIDIQKIPKNYKSGDNSLAKVFLDKKNIPSRVDLDPKLNQLRPRPYYEEIFDFSKNKEKINTKTFRRNLKYGPVTFDRIRAQRSSAVSRETTRLRRSGGVSTIVFKIYQSDVARVYLRSPSSDLCRET